MAPLQYGEKKSSKSGRSVASLDSVVNLMSNIVLKDDESRGDEPDNRRLEESSTKKQRLEPHDDEIIRLSADTIQESNPLPPELDFSVPEWFFNNSLTHEMNTFSNIFKPALDMFDIGEFMWWGGINSNKELEDTACSKPAGNTIAFTLSGDSRDNKRVSKEAELSGSHKQILEKFRRMAV